VEWHYDGARRKDATQDVSNPAFRLVDDDLGMRPELAHAHLGLARLRRNAGAHEQAREHLTTATMLYREMDMRFWLEKAEAEFS
jgi:hypothetical protein